MPVDHYENFPVASFVLPRHLRPAVTAIYRFARTADDIADEGEAAPATRLAELEDLRRQLDRIAVGGAPESAMFAALQVALLQHRLPTRPLHDLLDAFSQDVTRARYRNFSDLLDYCRLSANPVGRLLLHLYGAADSENLRRSDAICTSLQLINFWQDIAIDWRKGRVYLPQDDLARFGVSEAQIEAGRVDDNWRRLMRYQIDRARNMMLDGAPLARALVGRIGLELRLIVAGGLRILQKLEQRGGDVFRQRPVIGALDWPLLLWRAVHAIR